jgi:hypothetical protein
VYKIRIPGKEQVLEVNMEQQPDTAHVVRDRQLIWFLFWILGGAITAVIYRGIGDMRPIVGSAVLGAIIGLVA